MDFWAAVLYMDSWSSLGPAKSRGGKSLFAFLNYLDFAVDFIGWGLGVAVSSGWLTWKWPDWFYWVVQSVPQGFNFGYLFRSDSTNENQVIRDTISGVIMLLLSAVYAAEWPASYRDAPKAPGLVLSANIFNSVSSICEAPLLAGNPWLVLEFVLPVKLTAATVSSILGFTAYVLGVED